jgi:hypothetical protein
VGAARRSQIERRVIFGPTRERHRHHGRRDQPQRTDAGKNAGARQQWPALQQAYAEDAEQQRADGRKNEILQQRLQAQQRQHA